MTLYLARRATCNEVMRVLRTNKDSVMAMLEAFVHDPLINWRLLSTADNLTESQMHAPDMHGGAGDPIGGTGPPSPPRRELSREQVLAAYGGGGDANEVLNERAVAVMKRMSDKLTGRDFGGDGLPGASEADSVPQQVQRLIAQATSHENLCQSYIGAWGGACVGGRATPRQR